MREILKLRHDQPSICQTDPDSMARDAFRIQAIECFCNYLIAKNFLECVGRDSEQRGRNQRAG